MTAHNEVPFDDMYGLIVPHWYENPYVYVLIASICVCVVSVWIGRNYILFRHKSKQAYDTNPVRAPSYWGDRLYTADLEEQKHIYTDFIRYIKSTVQQCYNVNGMALTDTELVTWAWQNITSNYAQHIQTIVHHAECVRFQQHVVPSDTLRDDYTIVNELASYMMSSES